MTSGRLTNSRRRASAMRSRLPFRDAAMIGRVPSEFLADGKNTSFANQHWC
jgi:hypothetical protein